MIPKTRNDVNGHEHFINKDLFVQLAFVHIGVSGCLQKKIFKKLQGLSFFVNT